MTSPFLCHCNHIAVPAVIEGNTMLVCRHLLQGSHYRMDPHHVPCGFKLEDTDPELQPAVRARVLHCKPRAFQALGPPRGSGFLDLYRPKHEIAARNNRVPFAEDDMDIDEAPIEEASSGLLEQSPPMDLHAYQKRCFMLERQLQASEAEKRELKQQLVELREEAQQDLVDLEEQCQAQVRVKEEEAEYYKKRYESVRAELHTLRRSTGTIVSNALQS